MLKAPCARLPDPDGFVLHVRPEAEHDLIAHEVGRGEAIRPRVDVHAGCQLGPRVERRPIDRQRPLLARERRQLLSEGLVRCRCVAFLAAAAFGGAIVHQRLQQA
eukprot:246902-Prymnesium_polylepis.1